MKRFILVLSLFLGACGSGTPQVAAVPQNQYVYQQNTCSYYRYQFGVYVWCGTYGYWI